MASRESSDRSSATRPCSPRRRSLGNHHCVQAQDRKRADGVGGNGRSRLRDHVIGAEAPQLMVAQALESAVERHGGGRSDLAGPAAGTADQSAEFRSHPDLPTSTAAVIARASSARRLSAGRSRWPVLLFAPPDRGQVSWPKARTRRCRGDVRRSLPWTRTFAPCPAIVRALLASSPALCGP